jgi:hypothetical protein
MQMIWEQQNAFGKDDKGLEAWERVDHIMEIKTTSWEQSIHLAKLKSSLNQNKFEP